MRSLRLLDRSLLAILVPLWSVCCVLHVKEVIRGRLAWVPVFVWAPENTDSYPTVRGFWPGSEAEGSGLVVGDRLIRVGEVDLRGVGPVGFAARVYEEVGPDRQVSLAFTRRSVHGETSLGLLPVPFPWRILPLTLGFAVTGVLAFVRAPGSRPARAYFLASLAYSLHWSSFLGGPRAQTYAWIAVQFGSSLVIFPLILRTAMLLPEELAPTKPRMPVWPWLFAVFGPIPASCMFGVPLPPALGLRALSMVNMAFIVTLLVLLTRNFRRAHLVGRRQLKWVIYGIYIVVTNFFPRDFSRG